MRRKTIGAILEITHRTGALLAAPAENQDVSECNVALCLSGFRKLPKEYARFLKKTNGYAWNGFEFFGTDEARREAESYVLRDIVWFNEYIGARKDLADGCLVLGRFDEDIYLYDGNEKKYNQMLGKQ